MVAVKNVLDCQFSFKCPQEWKALEKSPFRDIRFCNACKKEVFFCKNREQIAWARFNGHCVAVQTEFAETIEFAKPPEIELGMMLPPEE